MNPIWHTCSTEAETIRRFLGGLPGVCVVDLSLPPPPERGRPFVDVDRAPAEAIPAGSYTLVGAAVHRIPVPVPAPPDDTMAVRVRGRMLPHLDRNALLARVREFLSDQGLHRAWMAKVGVNPLDDGVEYAIEVCFDPFADRTVVDRLFRLGGPPASWPGKPGVRADYVA